MKKLEELKSILDSIEKIRDRQHLKTYPNEETALLHLGRVASLQPGQWVITMRKASLCMAFSSDLTSTSARSSCVLIRKTER